MTALVPSLFANNVDFLLDIPALGDGLLDKLDLMRANDPIFWSQINGAWMITGHAEVVQGYQGKLPLSSKRLPQLAVGKIPEDVQNERFPLLLEVVKNWLLNMDNPEHHRLRMLMVRAFSKPVVELSRPDVRRYVQEALDNVSEIDGPFDFLEVIGRVIAARMILSQLGLEDALIPKLHHWSLVLNSIGGVDLPIEILVQANDVLVEMLGALKPQFESRRKRPSDDFLSALVAAQEDGTGLSDAELFSICTVILVAGQDTTTNTMALGLAALSKDREATRRLREDPEILAEAIMEIQRKVAMSTMMSRIASDDFDWNGHHIAKGDFIFLFQAAANRDPAIFSNPDVLNFDRKQTQNLSFAPGVHHCVGFLLAKMVLAEFFPAFLRRFDFELVDPETRFAAPPTFRTVEHLNIRLLPLDRTAMRSNLGAQSLSGPD